MINLSALDYTLIILFFTITLSIGVYVSKKAGKSSNEFFLSGRTMPWWLLGVSMVATTFSTDTPNLVTDIVRTHGVSGNWVWWAFLLTGLLTVFVYAKLWRLGGFKGVVYTDFVLFFVAMGGAIGAAYYLVNIPEVGGIEALMRNENVVNKLSILPDFSNKQALITLFIIPLAVQWWSSWYPGAEPGGGGYIAQRMLAAKDENHAIGATFFFNIMHYAIRPWPWILVALASLVVFPDLASIQNAFPNITDNILGHDLAYSAMLTKLPSGLLGLVLASLIAAYMSTISTQLNWGASYIVYDFYKQQINPDATEKRLVAVGRISTIVLMVFSAILALLLQNALQLFELLLVFGAGTGLRNHFDITEVNTSRRLFI